MGILVIILGLMIYFLPSVLACSNKKQNASAIFVLNFILGWSLIGWVFALVWACCKDKPQDIVQIFNDNHKGTLGYVKKRVE